MVSIIKRNFVRIGLCVALCFSAVQPAQATWSDIMGSVSNGIAYVWNKAQSYGVSTATFVAGALGALVGLRLGAKNSVVKHENSGVSQSVPNTLENSNKSLLELVKKQSSGPKELQEEHNSVYAANVASFYAGAMSMAKAIAEKFNEQKKQNDQQTLVLQKAHQEELENLKSRATSIRSECDERIKNNSEKADQEKLALQKAHQEKLERLASDAIDAQKKSDKDYIGRFTKNILDTFVAQQQMNDAIENPALIPEAFEHPFVKAEIVDPETAGVSYAGLDDSFVVTELPKISSTFGGQDTTILIEEEEHKDDSIVDVRAVNEMESSAVHTKYQGHKAYRYLVHPKDEVDASNRDKKNKIVLVVAHGTFSEPGTYGADLDDPQTKAIVKFAQALCKTYKKDVEIYSVQWSGALDNNERMVGAQHISDFMIHALDDAGDTNLLIWTMAHSHGCNVINYAADRLFEKKGRGIDVGLHLASPDTQIMRDDMFDALRFGKLYSFYGLHDVTQVAGSKESLGNWNRVYPCTYVQGCKKGDHWVNAHNKYYSIRVACGVLDKKVRELTHGSIKIPTIVNLPGLLFATDVYQPAASRLDALVTANGVMVAQARECDDFTKIYFPNREKSKNNISHNNFVLGSVLKKYSWNLNDHSKDFVSQKDNAIKSYAESWAAAKKEYYDDQDAIAADQKYLQKALGNDYDHPIELKK